jgi:hypothetical protein
VRSYRHNCSRKREEISILLRNVKERVKKKKKKKRRKIPLLSEKKESIFADYMLIIIFAIS